MQAPIDLTATADVEPSPPSSPPPAPPSAHSQDTVIDILVENQRGAWLCGLPLFSSASLLQLDPAAWCNAHGKTSPVNVTNAQTPDPTWQWVWPTWYVDMSHDVDEEGWEYSLSFHARDWHGTHPWWHSFARRRRWVRMRRKGGRRHAAEPPSEGQKRAGGQHEAHMLNADYFTIHPTKTADRASTYAPSLGKSLTESRVNTRAVDLTEEPPEEIDNIQTLLRLLKAAKVDRERISMVLQFLDQGGQDIYYISEKMHQILSMFMFQYTRRQLLSRMLQKISEAKDHRAQHVKDQTTEHDDEREKIDNLLRAVKAAEDEVKSLEYWSDIRDMAQEGETLHGVDSDRGWHGWQGLDQSGASQAKAPALEKDGHIEGSGARASSP